MLASVKLGADFSRGCALSEIRPAFHLTTPSQFANCLLRMPVAARVNEVNFSLASSLFETFSAVLRTPHHHHHRRGSAGRSGLARTLAVPLREFRSWRSPSCYLPHSQDWLTEMPLEIQARSLSIPLLSRCPDRSAGKALRQRAPKDLCSLPSLLSALQGSDPRTSH
jgi:hypothetical protein